MTEAQSKKKPLEQECIAFCQYLIRVSPNAYVQQKYREAHYGDVLETRKSFDRCLLFLAKWTAVLKFLDAYTLVFSQNSVLRKKWLLLVAILESCPPSYQAFEHPDTAPWFVLLLKMAAQGMLFFVAFILSMIFLLPLQAVFVIHDALFPKAPPNTNRTEIRNR